MLHRGVELACRDESLRGVPVQDHALLLACQPDRRVEGSDDVAGAVQRVVPLAEDPQSVAACVLVDALVAHHALEHLHGSVGIADLGLEQRAELHDGVAGRVETIEERLGDAQPQAVRFGRGRDFGLGAPEMHQVPVALLPLE